MLTLFATPKPFRGHIGIIQRNAIESWKMLRPKCEIILFGDEEGAGETAREFGLRHEAFVERNEHGAKFLRHIFKRAQEIARHPLLCYANCDILLPSAFLRAAERLTAWRQNFLMVGQRWDLDISGRLNFSDPEWELRLVEQARKHGRQRPVEWIDYFAFPRGLFQEIPAMVIGRVGWDNWLLWRAGSLGYPVVDVSAVVTAVHQNHDYAYHPQGEAGVWYGQEAQRNIELAGGPAHLHSIENASHRLTERGLERKAFHWIVPARQAARRGLHRAASVALRATRPARHAMGLRQQTLQSLVARFPFLRGH